MELSFNHFKNVQDVDCYLCNPDRSLLSVIPARARNFILRFNTLSEFTCEVPKYVSNAKGDLYEHPYYDYIQTRRLINVDKIGWFKIVEAVETENGNGTSKSVRAESCESTFKEVGFAIENRVYKFYDELDEEDESYNPLNEEAMPSVVGQLYKQLGICCNLSVGDITPTVDYGDWTIIWIEPMLKYGHTVIDEDGNTIEYKTCRTLNENFESFGYDFMTSDVSQAFQVFFEFDFAHHAIKVKSTSKVAEKTDIYLSFDNVMKELSTTENSQDIVTVLTCEGTNLGINSVNPMGTNYICDFSYYMGSDENGYPWMSKALTDKINAWKKTVSDNEGSYAGLVENLQELYEKKTTLESKKTLIDKELLIIKKAADDYAANSYLATSPVDVENVETGEKSLASGSVYYTQEFNPEGERKFKIYKKAPVYTAIYDEDGEKIDSNYVFADEDYLYEVNKLSELSFEDEIKETDEPSLYFMDGDNHSYCKIIYGLEVQDASTVLYSIKGFVRYAPYCKAGVWQSIRETEQRAIDADIETEQAAIDAKLAEMKAISDECNILNFFSGADNANLLKELRCYWVDGKYTNDTLKGLDGDTVAENLSLSKELMNAGKVELARVAQPRFSFTVTSANFLKMPQFTKFAEQLAMGKVVTVEKNEDTRYNASLTEMSFSLDESDTFSLTFSNSLKLTDWGFTYADLFKSVSDTSRAVQANWTNLMEYSQEKETISNLLINSLDRTLRAGLDNAYNQEFVVDTSGILGRKFKADNTAYEKEQLRIINNVIMFTDDNWETASAALGKITYVDPTTEKETTKYGLIADSIVGRLFVGEHLWIGDTNGYVTINGKGIEIRDEAKRTVFKATNDGSLTVAGYAKSDDLSKTDTLLKDFLGDYGGTLGDLQLQIDNKAETWYQGENPADDWSDKEKEAHIGDLWYNTDTNTTSYWNGKSWETQTIPDEVFDVLDGKAQIFYGQTIPEPPLYVNDLWVRHKEEVRTAEDGTTQTVVLENITEILRCKSPKNEGDNDYKIEDYWELISETTNDSALNSFISGDYADDLANIQSQVDKKAETWYQSVDPQTLAEWGDPAKHVGDLWYNTSTNVTKCWVSEAEINEETGEVTTKYIWKEQTISDAVRAEIFDEIDSKAQIFYGQDTPTLPYYVDDLWVKKGVDKDGKELDNTTVILKCTTSKGANDSYSSSDWTIISTTTDDTKANEALGVTTEFVVDHDNDLIKMNSKTLYLGGELLIIDTDNLKFNVGNSNQLVIDAGNLKLNVDGDGALEVKGSITADELFLETTATIGGALQSKNYTDELTITQNAEITSKRVTLKSNNGLYATYELEVSGTISISGNVSKITSFKVNSITVDIGYSGPVASAPQTSFKPTETGYTLSTSSVRFTSKVTCMYSLSSGYTLPPTIETCNVTLVAKYDECTGGLKITFGDTPSITSPYFLVDSDGKLIANDVTISGAITATSLTIAEDAEITGTLTANDLNVVYTYEEADGNTYTTTALMLMGGYGTVTTNSSGTQTGFGVFTSWRKGVVLQCLEGNGSILGSWTTESAMSTSSDRNVKNSIKPLDEGYSEVFDKLVPVSYKYNEGSSNRTHTGFIAQDIEDALADSGLATEDFAAVLYDQDDDGNKTNYRVRYEELIALCVNEIQKLKKELKEIKNET